MRMAEVRARYAARSPRRAEALLLWRAGAAGSGVQDRLYPSLHGAMRAARALLADPRCGEVCLYDGRHLHDRPAIARYLARDHLAWRALLLADRAHAADAP